MNSCNYQGVTLTDGPLKRQYDEVCAFYRDIPNDDLLHAYRVRAGRVAPGKGMGGHYIGHNPFGQYLSGFARIYAISHDTVYRDKSEALMHGWADCIEPDGFFFVDRNPALPHYYYDKMVSGLVDLYTYCGLNDALVYLRRITEWAVRNLVRTKHYARPTGEDGEWYTLSENLYRAYLVSGDTEYRDFAEVWEYREFWDQFSRKDDIFQHPMDGGWYHAYSHVNSLCGLGAAYLVKNEEYYLETLKNAYDFLWETQLWATGGYGPNECLMPRSQLVKMLEETKAHFETQCGSWAVFKLTKYLIQLTGDAKYGDWVERLLYNGIGASVPVEPDGRVFYYSDYHLGGTSKRPIHPWTCCTGSRIQAVADYHDLLYFHDDKNLYVNLFVPSTVCWLTDNAQIEVVQDTNFPESEATELVVHVASPTEFAINVRVPGWLTGPLQAFVNGQVVDVQVNEKQWAVVERIWENGDKLTIELPMNFWVNRIDLQKEFPTAIMYGPVTMAVRSLGKNPSKLLDFTDLPGVLVPSVGEPLTYHLASDHSILIRPFYQYRKEQGYFLYLDPTRNLLLIPYKQLIFSSGWKDDGSRMSTNTDGATVECSFDGTGIRILGSKSDDGGKFEVWVDQKLLGTVDQYGSNPGEAAHWDFAGFEPGVHSLKLILLDEKASKSHGNTMNIAELHVFE